MRRRLVLVVALAALCGMGGCQAIAGAIGGAWKDIQSGIRMASEVVNPDPRFE